MATEGWGQTRRLLRPSPNISMRNVTALLSVAWRVEDGRDPAVPQKHPLYV
ncbi:hypothetical protein F2P79_010719 [Pimephales promelas]|nr:hypothetical protein F2P79_010719 [Pimephales promelas]